MTFLIRTDRQLSALTLECEHFFLWTEKLFLFFSSIFVFTLEVRKWK